MGLIGILTTSNSNYPDISSGMVITQKQVTACKNIAEHMKLLYPAMMIMFMT
jgi:hypothetical protein